MNANHVLQRYRFPMLALTALALVNGAGCGGADAGGSANGSGAGSDGADATQPLAGMPLVARVALSPKHLVDFYDCASGIVIRELGPADEADQRVDIGGLRSLGMTAMYRQLMKDDKAVVPPALLDAEKKQQAILTESRAKPAQSGTAPPAKPSLVPNPMPRITSAGGGTGGRPNTNDDTGAIAQALGGLSTDAEWWASLPVSQTKNITYPAGGGFGYYSSWFDIVNSQTDITYVQTNPVDSEYYESTAFAQGDDAHYVVFQWNPYVGYVKFVDTTVPYRNFQTISAPPQNGAYFYTEIYANDQVVGYAERLRLAMPQPTFLNNNPSDVSYDFSNDIQGITHDDDNWYLSRTNYDHDFDPLAWPPYDSTPTYGQLAKIPFTSSLSSQPPQVVTMPSAWRPTPISCTPSRMCTPGKPGYVHFGDIVRVDSRIYLSMQGSGTLGVDNAGAAIAVYDLDLNPITYATLPHNTGASLVAYNPQDGLFYVGGENADGPNTFQKYRLRTNEFTGALQALYVGTLYLNQATPSIQGAKFSARGNLWLLTGYGGADRNFFGIDAVTGAVLVQGTLDPGDADEAEGLDILDLERETRPGMSGQLHLMMLDNHALDDSWWLMHWSAPMDRL